MDYSSVCNLVLHGQVNGNNGQAGHWDQQIGGREDGGFHGLLFMQVIEQLALTKHDSFRKTTGWPQPVLTGGQEERGPDPPLSHRYPAHPVPQEQPLVLGLGQELPGGVPVALQHLQLQAEGGLHILLHQPPEGLAGLQSPEQPHGLQAAEAASRQRGAAGQVQLPVVRRLVPAVGLEELARLVPQGCPQRHLLPRAQALHGDAQRLVEEAAGGRREADAGGHGGQAAGGEPTGDP